MKFRESTKRIVHGEYKTISSGCWQRRRKARGPFSIKSIAAVPAGLFG